MSVAVGNKARAKGLEGPLAGLGVRDYRELLALPKEWQDLAKAIFELIAKQDHHRKLWNYYEGFQELVFASARVQNVFQKECANGNLTSFRENWCAIIVDAVTDRIELEKIEVVGNESATEKLNEISDDTALSLEVIDAVQEMDVVGESYLFAWKSDESENDEGDEAIQVVHNKSTDVQMFYSPQNPKKKDFAAKWWVNPNTLKCHVTLYYKDALWYFVTKETKDKALKNGKFDVKKWELDESEEFGAEGGTADNPFNQIPVFHLRLSKRGIAELDNVIPLQDIINKLLSDMMVSAEFQAFPQRWAITNSELGKGELNAMPNSVIQFPPSDRDTQPVLIGQFGAALLENFTKVMDRLSFSCAVITRTPRHFFWAQSGDPSGEALTAMEAPLNRKVQLYIKRLNTPISELGAFLLKLDGSDEVALRDIKPIFETIATTQPRTRAETRNLNTQAGIPIQTQLEKEGWDKAEIEDLNKTIAATTAVEGAVDSEGVSVAAVGAQPNAQATREAENKVIDDLAPKVEQEIAVVLEVLKAGVADALLQSDVVNKVLKKSGVNAKV